MRCFLAISLPEDVTDALLNLQHRVKNARWISDENLHITLAFLGDCEPNQLSDLDVSLGSIRMDAFELTLAGTNSFGSAKPKNLHVKVAESEPLRRLQAKVDRMAHECEILTARRKFIPHVTLAWCSGGVIPVQAHEWVQRHNLYKSDPFPVTEFTLFRSDLGNGPSIYTELAGYPLTLPT